VNVVFFSLNGLTGALAGERASAWTTHEAYDFQVMDQHFYSNTHLLSTFVSQDFASGYSVNVRSPLVATQH
jgi:hypothetical protein